MNLNYRNWIIFASCEPLTLEHLTLLLFEGYWLLVLRRARLCRTSQKMQLSIFNLLGTVSPLRYNVPTFQRTKGRINPWGMTKNFQRRCADHFPNKLLAMLFYIKIQDSHSTNGGGKSWHLTINNERGNHVSLFALPAPWWQGNGYTL